MRYGSVRSPAEDRKKQLRLANNAKEREQYDHLANLYSILRSVELLEKCWSLNIVPTPEYVSPFSSKISGTNRNAPTFVSNSRWPNNSLD